MPSRRMRFELRITCESTWCAVSSSSNEKLSSYGAAATARGGGARWRSPRSDAALTSTFLSKCSVSYACAAREGREEGGREIARAESIRV